MKFSKIALLKSLLLQVLRNSWFLFLLRNSLSIYKELYCSITLNYIRKIRSIYRLRVNFSYCTLPWHFVNSVTVPWPWSWWNTILTIKQSQWNIRIKHKCKKLVTVTRQERNFHCIIMKIKKFLSISYQIAFRST